MKTIFYKPISTTILAILVLGLGSCDLSNNKAEPEKSFIRIYENGIFNQDFYPLAITKTTEDNGYLVLGKVFDEETDFLKATIVKLDNQGNAIYSKISNDIFNPTENLFYNGTNYYFVAMDEIGLNARLVKADSTFETLAQVSDTYYPLATSKINNELYIMGYDPLSRQTTLTKTNEGGTQIWKSAFEVFEDVQENIFEHLLLRRRPFAFFISEAGSNHVAINGLNNFTLAVTYVAKNNGEQSGILNGVRYEYGVSALSFNTQSNSAAIARHTGTGNHVFTGNYTNNINGVGASKDVVGLELPEFAPFAKVVIKSASIKGKNVNIFTSNTKLKKMAGIIPN